MASSGKWYTSAGLHIAKGDILWESHSIKMALVTSSYAFDQDAHTAWSHITNEVVGTGYTAGGQVIGNRSLSADATTNGTFFLGDDVIWPSSTITARGAVVYNDTPGTAATKWLLGFIDFGADKVTTNNTFPVTFPGRLYGRWAAA